MNSLRLFLTGLYLFILSASNLNNYALVQTMKPDGCPCYHEQKTLSTHILSLTSLYSALVYHHVLL